jgi:hypothetical protein
MDFGRRLLGEKLMGMFSRMGSFFGRSDDDGLSVPPMDGVLKPNTLLDAAHRVLDLPAIDNLAASPHGLFCSSGHGVFRIDTGQRTASLVRSFTGPVTMLAAAPGGTFSVAVEATGVGLLNDAGDYRQLGLSGENAGCVTAGLFADDDTLLLALGSRNHSAPDWKRDLMSHGRTGRVIRHTIASRKTEAIGDGLAFPYGLAQIPDGGIAVVESWRHRILIIGKGQSPQLALGELPAYPARLALASGVGFWLALFAPRRQLTELVLREDDYRAEMMATIAPEAWIGPDFADSDSEEQPLQSGSVRQMGIMKPWAPSRSYGLVVRLDAQMTPIASYHSRADGKVHGIASIAEFDGALYVASRGAGRLVKLDLTGGMGA